MAAPEAAPQAHTFNSFAEFYPFYLSEHRDRVCRRLHFIGSTIALVCIGLALWTSNAWWLLAAVLSGYAFAWVGHFAFEKNRPATFKHPLYSLMGDWRMYWEILRSRVAL